MNNSLGFLLAYKSAEGLPKNKRLLYGILAAQAPAGDLSQAIVPILLAKKEVEKQSSSPVTQPTDPVTKPTDNQDTVEQNYEKQTEQLKIQLYEVAKQFEAIEQQKDARKEQQQQMEELKKCLDECLKKMQAIQSTPPTQTKAKP